jgi:hypothetical protein
MSQQIVISVCFGGFGLSDKAFERLIELGMKVTRYKADHRYEDPEAEIVDMNDASLLKTAGRSHFGKRYSFTRYDTYKDGSEGDGSYGYGAGVRTDPRLIQVVEELGKEANGDCAELKIVEVPDDVKWHIEEYDGNESVHQDHQFWN